MKRLVCLLVTVAILVLPERARADVITMFSGLTTSGTFQCTDANGLTNACDLRGFSKVSFQVTSASGSVATVLVQIRNSANDPWSTVATINNPGPSELGYNGPGVGEMQVVVTWTSGTLRGTLVRTK